MAEALTPTIGLEVHLHLATRTKLFCPCAVEYDAPPNARVCPVCLGMPGVLPVLNERAVELAVRMALALGCTIPDLAKWDRKHYYYPDLPKNYQISQYDQPLGVGGFLEIPVEGGVKRIGIIRVHLEEDAGKLMHAEGGGNSSVVDLNRTGTPLLEIVSEPDMNSAEEVRAYSTALRQLAVYLGVGECNMQLGQMRFEPNISLRIGTGADGRPRYTPITEIKNLNSFRSVEHAVAFEIARHREECEADPKGYTLENLGKQTRGWMDDREVTFLQRSKEEAHDYRYFPEPDLVPFVPDRKWVEEVRASMPETPQKIRRRLIEEYGLSQYYAEVMMQDREVADFYPKVAVSFDKIMGREFGNKYVSDWPLARKGKVVGNWFNQDVQRAINERGIRPNDFRFTAEQLAELMVLVEKGTINRNTGTEVFNRMLETGKSAATIVEEESLAQTSDAGELERIVEQVIAANPGPADDFRGGKDKALGRLIGEAMKASGGKANPKVVRELLVRKLRG
ncbi:MAG: Asp-tRNA(Asn)/Glu-tRNA(Gln) amidotransferase subunit GatB [Phycisphaerae bacterium]|nr:Asp-tRNA(Asn)/Glu-tRNA(Gln) amidotransferase subunit GatB [Phycisphaerae bacterium]